MICSSLFFAGGDDVDGGVAHLLVAASALAEPLLEVFALECAGKFHCAVLTQSQFLHRAVASVFVGGAYKLVGREDEAIAVPLRGF